MSRPKISRATQTELLVRSRRRCALCFGLNHDQNVKAGQIAHLDQNPENNDLDNLVWLCLEHHDQYDSRTSQSKGLTDGEISHYRMDLYSFNEAARAAVQPGEPYVYLSPEAAAVAEHLNRQSDNGRKFDPQEAVADLPDKLGVSAEDVELAIDELVDARLVELTGRRQFVYPLDRLFWETDPLFSDTDPVLDAQEVARFIVNYPSDAVDCSVIAVGLNWTARRLNPAATYLAAGDYARARPAIGSAPYAMFSLVRTIKTKRLVKDLNSSQSGNG